MKKNLTVLIALLGVTSMLCGKDIDLSKYNFIMKKPGGKPYPVTSFTKVESSGKISFKRKTIGSILKPSDYYYAYSKREDVKGLKEADAKLAKNDFAGAVSAYDKIHNDYKFLGWDVYAILKQGEALQGMKKIKEAVKKLELLKDYEVKNPLKEDDMMKAYKLLASLYILDNQIDNAENMLKIVGGRAKDDATAAFALNARGGILEKKGAMKDAINAYLQTILLFPIEISERENALCQVANLLKASGDRRAQTWADMLKSEYPDSKFIKKLK